MSFNFNTQLYVGQKAEAYVLDNILSQSQVSDVRLDPEYQVKGIDFITPDGTIEVKSERWDNTRVALEVFSNKQRNKLGWLHTCQADYIYWMKPSKLLIIDWKPTQQYVLDNLSDFRRITANTPVSNTFYTSECVLVPFEFLRIKDTISIGENKQCQII